MSLCCLKKMSNDKEDPVKKFFRCPDLVEKLLPYLPPSDILSLAEAGFSCVLNLLKRASVWETLVKKTLGLGFYSIWEEERVWNDRYWTVVQAQVEEERVKIWILIRLIQIMKDEKSRPTHIQAVLCGIASKSGTEEGTMMKIRLTKLELPVNALCFLLLEEVEGAFGSTFQDVVSFSVRRWWIGGGGRLGEPMLSALSNRASRQQMKMTMEGQCKEIQLNNKGSAEALLNLASMGALEKGID